jgi:uncharacterized YccA/Bax inhibitor family protein
MMAWFTSLKGVVALSFVALLSLLVRSYADTRFILVEDYGHFGMGFVVLWILGYTAIVGGWIWALVAAAGGSRRALIALLAYALVTGLGFGVASLVLFASVPAEVLIFSASLITGVLAATSVSFRLREASQSGWAGNQPPPSKA